jgi:signal transduction histidine kinase
MGRLLQSERLRKSGTPPQRQPVNMHDLLVSAARNVSNQAEQKSLTITVDAPSDITVRSDGELITLVVQNLVGNAVKYSSKGVVRLSAACADGACTVSVSDEGPGVAAEHMQRIFNAFDRGEAYGQPGVGLGLAIASQAARLLGGKLTVDSKVGVGSTFSLILPEMLETE